jgi:tetratricopeptide (TPR) repeat protein
MASRSLGAALLLCSITISHASAQPRWSRVDTPHFVVIGTGSEKRLQTLGAQFEGFREALTRLLSPTATSTAVPTVVVAFPDDKSLKPFKPVYEGKTVEIGGLFVARSDVNYILIGPQITPDSLRNVFHEYSHLIINNVAPAIPLWLNEGLAEYYSSFELGNDGRKVVIGRPILPHLRTLNEEPLIPLKELIGTKRDSPQYNENSRRSTFYAQVWALVHMLLHDEPDRRAAFSAYVNEVGAATAPEAAWTKHFGKSDLSEALEKYARRRTMMAGQFTLPEKITRTPGTAVALAPATADAMFGELLMALDRPEAAAERFTRALALDPRSALALIGVARIKNQPAPAVALGDEDWLTAYLIGVALLERDSPDSAALASARAALERAIANRPDLPNAQVRYAEALELAGADAPRAVEALQKAHAAVPVRDDYTFALARAVARAGDIATARGLLGQVIARPHLPGARDHAFELMRRLVSSGGESQAAGGSVDRPVFREVKTGETRAEGTLESIECASSGITVVVRLADRLARFHAKGFGDVEFITYREGLKGAVGCGPRTPPDPIYATWRADGSVVAIEFLPKLP